MSVKSQFIGNREINPYEVLSEVEILEMLELIKPSKLNRDDTIAIISPSWGCAGSNSVKWKYMLGVERLNKLGLNVIAAPNALKGTTYLRENPQARAEDVMWAFENKDIKAVIANIGGNDLFRILPFILPNSIADNPKILCGYSDVMTLHLFCYKLGLSTFYGDNLITSIADGEKWHEYSKYWFEKVFMSNSIIGEIAPSKDWTNDVCKHTKKDYFRKYVNNTGYMKIQGEGKVTGRLFGGHMGLMELDRDGIISLNLEDFKDKILFFEEIPQFTTLDCINEFFEWLGEKGYLKVLKGIVIGKIVENEAFVPLAEAIRQIVSNKYCLPIMPIMYGVNVGHSSPTCILPYGAKAELDIENMKFSILESGVIC